MATFAIGDIQGCFDELEQLLDRINFNPDRDIVYFLGDLVNRGPKSLEVLRFLRQLGDTARCVLGNHDLHLLAVANGAAPGKKDSFDAILKAPDREDLLNWLSGQPLARKDSRSGTMMLHAGVAPQWTSDQLLAFATEASREISRARKTDFFNQMYGDKPTVWSDELTGASRIRFIVNCLTRMRYCDQRGALNMKLKGSPGNHDSDWLPWFEVPTRKTRGIEIAFGHWSTLGRVHWPDSNVWGLDTGCVWGGSLSALCLESGEVISVPSSIPPAFS